MSVARSIRLISVSEYLRLEASAEQKHELIDGQIIAMSGGTPRASRIAVNVLAALHRNLRGKPCQPFDSNLRIRIPRTSFLTYPDISVICGPIAIDPEDSSETTVTNPKLIFEILSPTTERFDRGAKFTRYRRLSSLEEYVLISQESARVESFHKQKDGTWNLADTEGLKSIATLRSLKMKLKLADVYLGVKFD